MKTQKHRGLDLIVREPFAKTKSQMVNFFQSLIYRKKVNIYSVKLDKQGKEATLVPVTENIDFYYYLFVEDRKTRHLYNLNIGQRREPYDHSCMCWDFCMMEKLDKRNLDYKKIKTKKGFGHINLHNHRLYFSEDIIIAKLKMRYREEFKGGTDGPLKGIKKSLIIRGHNDELFTMVYNYAKK